MFSFFRQSRSVWRVPLSRYWYSTEVGTTLAELRHWRLTCGMRQQTIGFVPTMGALHDGHLALVKRSKAENDRTIVSIFVNPKQFGPNEDFANYPRTIATDVDKLKSVDVDFVFLPTGKEIYQKSHATFVDIEGVDELSEGAVRPLHFRGVATIVAKFFNLIRPDQAYFGQKDGLQSIVVRKMVDDLNFPIKIHIVPTLRESDGLAMSSRNVYLSQTDRAIAPIVYRSLRAVEDSYERGERRLEPLKQAAISVLEQEPSVQLQYISLADTDTGVELTRAVGELSPTETVEDDFDGGEMQGSPLLKEQREFKIPGALCSIAVKLGKTRLIDNILLFSQKKVTPLPEIAKTAVAPKATATTRPFLDKLADQPEHHQTTRPSAVHERVTPTAHQQSSHTTTPSSSSSSPSTTSTITSPSSAANPTTPTPLHPSPQPPPPPFTPVTPTTAAANTRTTPAPIGGGTIKEDLASKRDETGEKFVFKGKQNSTKGSSKTEKPEKNTKKK